MEYSPFLETVKWRFNLSLHWTQLTTKENGSSVYSGHVLKWILSLYHSVSKIHIFYEKQGIPIKTHQI